MWVKWNSGESPAGPSQVPLCVHHRVRPREPWEQSSVTSLTSPSTNLTRMIIWPQFLHVILMCGMRRGSNLIFSQRLSSFPETFIKIPISTPSTWRYYHYHTLNFFMYLHLTPNSVFCPIVLFAYSGSIATLFYSRGLTGCFHLC